MLYILNMPVRVLLYLNTKNVFWKKTELTLFRLDAVYHHYYYYWGSAGAGGGSPKHAWITQPKSHRLRDNFDLFVIALA